MLFNELVVYFIFKQIVVDKIAITCNVFEFNV